MNIVISKEKYKELCDESKILHLLAHALEAVLPLVDMFGSDELRANTHAVLDAWHMHLQVKAEIYATDSTKNNHSYKPATWQPMGDE